MQYKSFAPSIGADLWCDVLCFVVNCTRDYLPGAYLCAPMLIDSAAVARQCSVSCMMALSKLTLIRNRSCSFTVLFYEHMSFTDNLIDSPLSDCCAMLPSSSFAWSSLLLKSIIVYYFHLNTQWFCIFLSSNQTNPYQWTPRPHHVPGFCLTMPKPHKMW